MVCWRFFVWKCLVWFFTIYGCWCLRNCCVFRSELILRQWFYPGKTPARLNKGGGFQMSQCARFLSGDGSFLRAPARPGFVGFSVSISSNCCVVFSPTPLFRLPPNATRAPRHPRIPTRRRRFGTMDVLKRKRGPDSKTEFAFYNCDV